MRKILTAVLILTVPAVVVLSAGPVPAFDPAKQLPPKSKMTGPPTSPAMAETDKQAKERLERQLKMNAERTRAEKAREEELKKATYVGKVPEKNTPSKQPSQVKK